MKQYSIEKIRTIAVIGHPGSGKTSFMESVLHVTGSKDKKGSVEEKNTTSDFLVEEKKHLSSISTSLIPVEYNGYKFNFLDTPGNRDLVSEVYQTLSVVKGAILMIDGSKGIDIGTELVLSDLSERNIPTIIFINKMDKENIKIDELLTSLRKMIKNQAVPFLWPIVQENDFKGYVNLIDMKANVLEGGKIKEAPLPEYVVETVDGLRENIVESVAMTSEELLDKHFGGEELTYNEICGGLREGVLSGDLKPVVVGSVKNDIGVRDILDMIEQFMPAPNDLKPKQGKHPKTGEVFARKTNNEEPFSAYVFKTTIDPFVGSMNMIKVFSGSISSGQKILVANDNNTVKVGAIAFGGDKPVLIAGPCSVESREQIIETALQLKEVGFDVLRGGVFASASVCDLAVASEPEIGGSPGYARS